MADHRTPRLTRLAKEGGWIVAGQIAAVAGALVLVRVLTDRLGPAEYGHLALGLTLAGLVNQTVLGGVAAGIARLYAVADEQRALRPYLAGSFRLLGYATFVVLVLGLALMGAMAWMGYAQYLGLASAAIVFSVLSGVTAALVGIQNAARQRALASLSSGVDAWLRILFALAVMVWLGPTSTAAVLGYCCSSLLLLLSQVVLLHPAMRGKDGASATSESRRFLRQIWEFSWPFCAWGIFTWLQQASDRWALAGLARAEDVGLYAVLFQLGYAPLSMVTAMALTFLAPILYQRSGDARDHARNAGVHRVVWKTTFATLALTLVGVLLAFLTHAWLFRFLVAPQYRHVSYLLPWMVMAGGLFAAGQMLALKLMSEMKSARLALAKIVTALLGVGFNVYGAAVAGLTGVIAGLLAFSVVYLAWMIWLTRSQGNTIDQESVFMTPTLKSEE
jgi:O-antigen/teichoic acid export membrane protein